jgi:oligopeptide transport system permease protein
MQIAANERFEHVGVNEERGQMIVRPSISYWRDAWRRLKMNKAAMFGLAVIIFCTIMSIIGPMMTEHTYYSNNLMLTNQAPSSSHWFGTDQLGRDLWARVWVGARVSLFIGFFAAFLQTTVGLLVGGIAGMAGGKIDMIIMRVIDVLIAIPYMIVVILMMVILGSGIVPLILAFTVTGWLPMARLVRGQILQLREQEYVMAAKVLGASNSRLLFRHMIPNTIGVIIVELTMAIPGAIFAEAFLSFIGIGIAPPMTSWGQLSRTGAELMRAYPYQLLIPAFFISITMLSLNLLGDGLRDALDPRLRK